jgi:hypothetical protein
MKSDFRIISLNAYVLRTPLLPLSLYLDTLENYSNEKTKLLYQKPIIREAINLASPDLVKQLDKWVNSDPDLSIEKAKKLEITFLKYLARMSSRCTPFGLFAGCSLGRIASKTEIILEDSDSFQRVTQFDMQFWVALLQEIANKKEVIPHLKYYPNDSIYKTGDFYRYIEYSYIETKREHSIAALRKSLVLTELLDNTKSGMTIEEMVLILADNQSETTEAREFVLKLIGFQFLISELDAVITGNIEWERILSVLKKIPALDKECQILEKIKEQLFSLDETLIPSEKKYQEIEGNIKQIGIGFDEKYLFQTDLNTSTTINTLNATVSKKVLQAIHFLNGIQTKKSFRIKRVLRKLLFRDMGPK